MLKTRTLIVFVAVLAAGMLACQGEDYDVAEETSETAVTETTEEVDEMTARIWVDDPTLGTELNEEGRIAFGYGENDFEPGETIYYAMEIGDAPANASITVRWYGPDDVQLLEETQQVTNGQDYIHFEADTTGWEPGEYRAEIHTEGQLAHSEDFEIEEMQG